MLFWKIYCLFYVSFLENWKRDLSNMSEKEKTFEINKPKMSKYKKIENQLFSWKYFLSDFVDSCHSCFLLGKFKLVFFFMFLNRKSKWCWLCWLFVQISVFYPTIFLFVNVRICWYLYLLYCRSVCVISEYVFVFLTSI
jgi:hypothetical protein